MTIASEITKLNTNLINSYTACQSKGATIPTDQNFDNLATCIGSIQTGGSPNLQTKSVSLTDKNGQTFSADNGYDGLSQITVTPNNEARTVTPTTSSQSLTVNSGYSGNGTITVNAVTSSIDNNITASNIKKDVTILGVTGTYEGSGGGGTESIDIPREVKDGVYQIPTEITSFTLPSNVTHLDDKILPYAFYNCTSLTTIDFSSLLAVSGENALTNMVMGCNNLLSLDFSNLEEISGFYSLYSICNGCTSLTTVDFSNLVSVTGEAALSGAFSGCTSLTTVDFSNLGDISGEAALSGAFSGCTSLTTVDFSNLVSVTGEAALIGTFEDCTSLTSLSFPNLEYVSNSEQFDSMLAQVPACTVHFPAALESEMIWWESVQNGFDGTNTIVSFDL